MILSRNLDITKRNDNIPQATSDIPFVASATSTRQRSRPSQSSSSLDGPVDKSLRGKSHNVHESLFSSPFFKVGLLLFVLGLVLIVFILLRKKYGPRYTLAGFLTCRKPRQHPHLKGHGTMIHSLDLSAPYKPQSRPIPARSACSVLPPTVTKTEKKLHWVRMKSVDRTKFPVGEAPLIAYPELRPRELPDISLRPATERHAASKASRLSGATAVTTVRSSSSTLESYITSNRPPETVACFKRGRQDSHDASLTENLQGALESKPRSGRESPTKPPPLVLATNPGGSSTLQCAQPAIYPAPSSRLGSRRSINRPQRAYHSAKGGERDDAVPSVPQTPRIFRQHPGDEVTFSEGRRISSTIFRNMPEWGSYF